MAATDDAKRTWSSWVNHWLNFRKMTQSALVEASGGDLNLKTVSKWVNGGAAASADLAVLTARLLKAPRAEAMKAAGHPLVAEELAKVAPQADVDPGIQKILAADLLSDEEKAKWIRSYQADLARAADHVQQMLDAVEGTRRDLAT